LAECIISIWCLT